MKLAPFILLGLFSLPLVSARANLGDTVAQVVGRYGKPDGFGEANSKSPFGQIIFQASGYQLVIFVLNNIEVGSRVTKLDHTAFGDAEIQNIMAGDANGTPWKPVAGTDPTTLQWSRDDGATVLYDKEKKMLIFTSIAMTAALGPAK